MSITRVRTHQAGGRNIVHRVEVTRRTLCLQDARQALDELTELNAEVEGLET